jgi:hypothetical protein
MNTILSHGEDGALSDALAGILGRLRGYPDGRSPGESEENLHREADGFVMKLAVHLRHAEEAVFPALQKVGWGSAGGIEELEKDHRLLGLYARDLAAEIREKNRERAYGVARSFLAVLLDHIQRETDGVAGFAKALEVSDAARLRALIERC